MKGLPVVTSRTGQHGLGQAGQGHTRPMLPSIKQEQGVETSTVMERSPTDEWIDSTTTCRPSPAFPQQPDNISYLQNVQNGNLSHHNSYIYQVCKT